MQIVQAVYNELTGRTEELTKFVEAPFRLRFDDLKQLDAKIRQMFEQYHIASSSTTVTIYFGQEARETYSSFERFSAFDSSTTKEVQNILLKYEFLIILPEAKRPQPYSLSIQLTSGLAVVKQAKAGLPRGLPAMAFLQGPSGKLSIEYVDYLVARTFLDTVSNWTDALDTSPLRQPLKFLVQNSQWVRRFTQCSLVVGALFTLCSNLTRWISTGPEATHDLARFLLWSVFILGLANFVGKFFGSLAERFLDDLYAASAIQLTRGDTKLIETNSSERRVNLLKAGASVVFSFLLGVLASIIANKFGA